MLAATFYNWNEQTELHPVAVAILLVMAVTMLMVPRRFALWPMLVVACFITPAQRVVIGGVDFGMLRLMVICGWLRLLIHTEYTGLRWNRLDSALVVFTLVRTFIVLFYSIDDPVPLFKNRLGGAVDILGMYFLFRFLVRGFGDARWAVLGFAWIGIPVAITFLAELVTGHNIFGAFGYVSEETIVRDTRFRCQGAFAHPIIAGCFWASMMPLMAALWWKGRRWRTASLIGLASSLGIVLTTASSTPVMAVVAAAGGAAMFVARRWLSFVRWGVLILLLALHLSMSRPVWYLISRVTVITGSTAYYRYQLIDKAIQHFDEWGAMGGIIDTGTWAPGLDDVANHYVLQGIQGGLPLLLAFAWIVALGFGNAGRMWRAARHNRARVITAWALGVALFVHCVDFLGVSYFGQINLVWNLQLAMLASLAPLPVCPRPATRRSVAAAQRQTAPDDLQPHAPFPSDLPQPQRIS